jgi:hypothetical protein
MAEEQTTNDLLHELDAYAADFKALRAYALQAELIRRDPEHPTTDFDFIACGPAGEVFLATDTILFAALTDANQTASDEPGTVWSDEELRAFISSIHNLLALCRSILGHEGR